MTAKKGKLKERHHWWPECLSERWCEADGQINVIRSEGDPFRTKPGNAGVIGNGHIIKLGRGKPSPWDESFEHVFDAADSAFPRVVTWLEGLDRRPADASELRSARFLPQPITNDQFAALVEGLVSLAVRSPMFRAAAVGAAIRLRGALPPDERHQLEVMNMRHCQRMIADTCKSGGKLAVLFAEEGEFIFGDGFYNTATGVSAPPISPRMLVPLTPSIAVLYTRPMAFMTEPRLVTLVLRADEVAAQNTVVQVYAKDFLYYRSLKPIMNEHFRAATHLRLTDTNNPVDALAQELPGVRSGHPLFGDFS